MKSQLSRTPLVVLVGCTASGKSALAYQLALQYDGEIIAADSRTIYRGLDVGTAKPSAEQRRNVPHHLIDIVDPDEVFTAGDLKQRAEQAIQNVAERGRLPILVGGTGLYIDAVLFDFSFRQVADKSVRQHLESLSVNELQRQLQAHSIALPQNAQNRRHLIRALETGGEPHSAQALRPNTLVIGLNVEDEVLRTRIRKRTQAMLNAGLEREVKMLVSRYGWEAPGLDTIGYKEFRPYLAEETTRELVATEITRHTIAYAKRQRTWFKRNKSIHWIKKQAEIDDLLTTFLSK